MAHGWLNELAKGQLEVYSAGVETHGLNPNAVKFMAEEGVDISSHTSNLIDEYNHIDFDFVITVCDNAKERCPYFPGHAKRFHQNFSDPSKVEGTEQEIAEAFRKTVREIREYCSAFLEEYL